MSRLFAGVALATAITTAVAARSSAPVELGATSIVTARISAPFDDLFRHAAYGDNYTVAGTFTFDGDAEPAQVSLRGNSSQMHSECGFPKLKLRVGTRKLKIGTHCDERADGDLTPELGRWANEKSPHREAVVYRLVAAVGVPTLRARAARITYVFTEAAATSAPAAAIRTITRDAMLLEDDEEALARLGASGVIDQAHFTGALDAFPRDAALDVAFAEAMIGNLDWCLAFVANDPKRCDAHVPIYNLIAARRADGGAFPVMYDFDLAGMVAGRREWFDGDLARFAPPRAAIEAEIAGQLQRMRSFYSRAELDGARERFRRHKNELYRIAGEGTVDPIGRRLITAYLDGFFTVISES